MPLKGGAAGFDVGGEPGLMAVLGDCLHYLDRMKKRAICGIRGFSKGIIGRCGYFP